jgi:hypothetical protein
MHPLAASNNEADEIERAEQAVQETRAELARSLQRVGDTGRRLVHEFGHELKPTLVVVAVVAGAAALVGVTAALLRRGRRRHHWLTAESPPALVQTAKGVGLWALRLVARRVAQEVASRLAEPAPPPPYVAG